MIPPSTTLFTGPNIFSNFGIIYPRQPSSSPVAPVIIQTIISITTPPKENLVFVGVNGLPEVGEKGVLYATSTDLFTWNGEGYTKMGALLWEEF